MKLQTTASGVFGVVVLDSRIVGEVGAVVPIIQIAVVVVGEAVAASTTVAVVRIALGVLVGGVMAIV